MSALHYDKRFYNMQRPIMTYSCEHHCSWGEHDILRDAKWHAAADVGFEDFVHHVRWEHGVDIKKGREDRWPCGVLGDRHFCYCNSCPQRDGKGLHLHTPEEVLEHLWEAHNVWGVEAEDNRVRWGMMGAVRAEFRPDSPILRAWWEGENTLDDLRGVW
jgi:hypothetical protein